MPERQCAGCKNQEEWGCFAKQGRKPDPLEDPRNAWLNPAHLPLTIDGEDVFNCPRQTIRENPEAWNTLFRFYAMYQKGHLPQQGAVLDQANKAIEIFMIMDAVNQECDAELEKRRNKPRGPHGQPR